MHYEVELGLIMGKTVRDLDPEDTKGAMDAIEGTLLLVNSTYIFSVPPNTRNLYLRCRLPPCHRHDSPKCAG
jgi:hypothetical protein